MHAPLRPADLRPETTAQWLWRLRKRLLVSAAVVALAGAAAWYSWSWWTTGQFIQSTDDAYVGGDVTTIASKVAGFIDTVAVTDNQPVKAGELLVKLDDRDYRAQFARAQASVDAQNATLANLDAARRLQQAVIAQADAETTATAAEVTRTNYDLERYRTLSAERFGTVQRFEQADADAKKALAADQKARAARDAAERQLDVIDTQKRQTLAALDQAIAERDLAKLNLGYTEIRAPIDGVVGNRRARAGAYTMVGAHLLSVVPAQGLWVDANFKESQLARMSAGQPVEVTADVLPGTRFRGHVANSRPRRARSSA